MIRTLSENVLMVREQLARLTGITFGGKRSLYEVCGYTTKITAAMYRDRYHRNAVASRLVEAKPQSTWRGGAELIEDEDPTVATRFEETWDEFNERLKIWSVFQRADILAGLGRYSVILIGATGKIEEPLQTLRGINDIVYLTIFSEDDAPVDEIDTDTSSPRYGLPLYYNLRHLTPQTTFSPSYTVPVSRRAHFSRCIHISDGCLDDMVYGVPRLERVWNLLDDLEKVTGGGSEAFWRRADAGIQLDVDKDLDFDETDEKKTEQQIDDYVHKFRRTLLTRGTTARNLGSQVADFRGPMQAIIAQISSGTGIPQRILMGSERGELASTTDRDNWTERIMDRRSDFASSQVVRPFIDRMIAARVLPKPKKYDVRWPDIRNLSDREKAEIANIWAKMNTNAGVTIVEANEIRDRVLGLPPLTELQQTPVQQLLPAGITPPQLGHKVSPDTKGDLSVLMNSRFARKWRVLSSDQRRYLWQTLLSKTVNVETNSATVSDPSFVRAARVIGAVGEPRVFEIGRNS